MRLKAQNQAINGKLNFRFNSLIALEYVAFGRAKVVYFTFLLSLAW